MAEYLASIFGTEKDKVNCSFYFKIGVCRHGDRCSRLHNKPTFSQEVFTELQEKYGEIEEMNVCDNLGDHLVGNVYVKFRREEDGERAVAELNNRWFNGQAVHGELSPVTDFRESCCRQYEMGECTRGGFCNFMHLRPISQNLQRQLYGRGPRHRLECKGAVLAQCNLCLPVEMGFHHVGQPGLELRTSGRPRGSILATIPERGTISVPLITGMAASEALDPLPFTPNRDRCSWQDLSSKPPSLSCPILPRLPGSIM
ncbi:splicing factor U2AF 26 kDa subunit isoform X2 [Pan troglodytes]|uniref:splicing factor U2AF 26 kDa subunit isoform X2 n=1 Tax=Pan troglodytes TaxID=9598 RepID=UPI0023F1B7A7|nr:splicing factor U2AF 26 kDa subunit isoform X2 [Pan troglodytes]